MGSPTSSARHGVPTAWSPGRRSVASGPLTWEHLFMRQTVVLSDLHLCESLSGEDSWMRFRQVRFAPDQDFVQFVQYALVEIQGGPLTVVFNGDTFDFEAPPVVDGTLRFDQGHATEGDSAERLSRILVDHAGIVGALADLLVAGHRVVFVAGNHDAHLAWPAVQSRLCDTLVATAMHRAPGQDAAALAARVVFRTWFYRTEDGVHVEHGHQYDHYCSFRDPTHPFTAGGRLVQPTMGSLSYRHLVSRMGYFNPYTDATFMLSLGEYVGHWAHYYAASKHSLGVTWARGAYHIMRELFAAPPDRDESARLCGVARAATETGIPATSIARHAALFARPVNDHAFSAARELWLDRAAFGAAGVLGVAAAALGGPVTAASAAVAGIAAFAAYERLLPKPLLDDTYDHVAVCQREIARIHGAKAVILGHTHKMYAHWDQGVFHANTGTWAPAYQDVDCTVPLTDGRPLVWLRSDGDSVRGGLRLWRRGHLVDVQAATPALAPAADGLLQPA